MNITSTKHCLIFMGFTCFLLAFVFGVLLQEEPLFNMLKASLVSLISITLTHILLSIKNTHGIRNARNAFNPNTND